MEFPSLSYSLIIVETEDQQDRVDIYVQVDLSVNHIP